MLKRKKYVIASVAVIIAIGIGLFFSLNSCSVYYYTVSELLDKGNSIYGHKVRVSGEIAEGSVEWNPEELALDFAITEGDQSLPVVYNRSRPEAFAEGKDVLAEGRLEADGVFHASRLMFQCPSKYSSQD